MITPALLLILLLVAPLVAGCFCLGVRGKRARRSGLVIALLATLITLSCALLLEEGAINPDGPQLITLLHMSSLGWTARLDGLTTLLLVGIALWCMPLLIWITTPRVAPMQETRYTMHPMGWALIAVSLTFGALVNDNVWLSALCWLGVGSITGILARQHTSILPRTPEEHFDLVALVLGPLLFCLVMIIPALSGHTSSLLDMTGRQLFTFWTGGLLILVLALACGLYPWMLWVRRVTQGITIDAIAVLLLLQFPLGLAILSRSTALITAHGQWPSLTLGNAAIPLNALVLVLGIATVVTASIVLLVEQDLLIITALIGALVMGWAVAAIGSADDHALIGFVILVITYGVAVGALLAVWSSLEWKEHPLRVPALTGLLAERPFHALAIFLAGLTAIGVPLLSGFAGMISITHGILALSGASILGVVALWLGNAIAFFGIARLISTSIRHRAADPIPADIRSSRIDRIEQILFMLVSGLILLIGIAPELFLTGTTSHPGPIVLAASALLSMGTSIPQISVSSIGLTLGDQSWLPGLLWAFLLGIMVVLALLMGRSTTETVPLALFLGGETPPDDQEAASIPLWRESVALARSALVLPGPRAWRDDVGEIASAQEAIVEAPEEIARIISQDSNAMAIAESEPKRQKPPVNSEPPPPEDMAGEDTHGAEQEQPDALLRKPPVKSVQPIVKSTEPPKRSSPEQALQPPAKAHRNRKGGKRGKR